ncbi:PREDICTED: mitochondrial inner membrane protease ATP23 homolog [Branchiostoma belcheri]|uniref:Mitochondrial inner membrane protease ATP23 n=1 Tax=Branchiostoma belcheri TaxID=7741 RepID=A0A6P4XZQ2_BRABE|nr:PREDICTED: mitochondrial inner membrane protease ATP23 homolog [Branchiostoma belcheri]
MAEPGKNHAGFEPSNNSSETAASSAQNAPAEFSESPQKDGEGSKREDLGYDLFHGRGKSYRETMTTPYGKFENLFDSYHPRCKTKLMVAMKSNPFVKLLLKAMEESGWPDWYNNLQHVACSEIRAANLSGDCHFSGELRRFQLKGVKKHHQTCVWQRAKESVKVVRNCTDEEASRAVDSVWDACFNDLAPFHKVPRNKKDAIRAARFRYDYDI